MRISEWSTTRLMNAESEIRDRIRSGDADDNDHLLLYDIEQELIDRDDPSLYDDRADQFAWEQDQELLDDYNYVSSKFHY